MHLVALVAFVAGMTVYCSVSCHLLTSAAEQNFACKTLIRSSLFLRIQTAIKKVKDIHIRVCVCHTAQWFVPYDLKNRTAASSTYHCICFTVQLCRLKIRVPGDKGVVVLSLIAWAQNNVHLASVLVMTDNPMKFTCASKWSVTQGI